MRHPFHGPFLRSLARLTLLGAALVPAAAAQGTAVGFPETFALAPDRLAVLDQLVPGTQDHYFYACLAHQQRGELDRVDELLRAWDDRHREDGRWKVIENRQVLLRYAEDPQGTFADLRRRLGLHYDQQRTLRADELDLPSRLDPALVSAEALLAAAWDHSRGDLDGFRDSALRGLVGAELDVRRLRSLLSRLERPDVPNLPALVVRDLAERNSGGFGSLDLHGRLLLQQLEACASLRPALLEDTAFQGAVLRRLRPGEDVDLLTDVAQREAFLERLQAFADRLSPAANSLKAHVLHHRLRHDLEVGVYDRERLLAYLRLPRQAPWANAQRLERRAPADTLVVVSDGFPTGMGRVGNDEPLVRAHLAHHLVADGDVDAFREWVDRRYLEQLLAEESILAGVGDMERWYGLLDDPGRYERLKDRVELEFPSTQRKRFAADEPVVLELDVKNVETLLVKVFEIQAENVYQETGREVDAWIGLDGLVAGVERTYSYAEGPLRRVRRSFEFPELTQPGVYVVDFIGNGTSSRAVVHKGSLEFQQRLGSAGHVLQVLDETGALRPDASARFGGRVFEADEHGEIVIPFSTGPGEKPLVLRAGGRVTLTSLEHREEHYDLGVGVFLERETLVAGETGVLLLRPNLLLDGVPVDLGLVLEPTLVLRTLDVHGNRDELRRPLQDLGADHELRVEFAVPADLQEVRVALEGRVRNLSVAETQDLRANGGTYPVNRVAATVHTATANLLPTPSGWVVEVRGRAGEVRADVPLQVQLGHLDYATPVRVPMITDAAGRLHLGRLPRFASLSVSGLPVGTHTWDLEDVRRTYPRVLHLALGEVGRVPTLAAPGTSLHDAVSLIELRDGLFSVDRAACASLQDGYVLLRDLPAGDHDLALLQDGVRVHVRVTDGVLRGDHLVGRSRALERTPNGGLQVIGAGVQGEELVVRLAGVDPSTRVHVAAGRFHPAFDPLAQLVLVDHDPADLRARTVLEANLASGREIGDEYRYILERRFAARFPGNMLPRPSLLLNPWALETTNNVIGIGGGAGGKFGGRMGGSRNLRAAGGASSPGPSSLDPGWMHDLDYLPGATSVVTNLRPDDQGVVRVPLAQLGDGQRLQVLALDERDTVQVTVLRGEVPLRPRDRRLLNGLEPERHLVQQRRVELVGAGQEVRVEDASVSQAHTFDDLGDLFDLYRTLDVTGQLARFEFLARWDELERSEQLALYGEHACHELHLFLHQKDRRFFDEVVRSYLSHKLHPTFLDRWLLDESLVEYLDPWAFQQLNVVERILLARRVAERHDDVARALRERYELRPQDPVVLAGLFDDVLESGKLGQMDQGGLRERLAAKRPSAPGAPAPDPSRSDAPAQAPAEEPVTQDFDVADHDEVDAEEEVEELLDVDAGLAERRRARSRDADRREEKNAERFFDDLDPTRTYAEHAYWHRRLHEMGPGLVELSGFWVDLALCGSDEPFFSARFAEATGSVNEMLLALALLDLPFAAAEHRYEDVEAGVRMVAGSRLVLVREDLAAAQLDSQAAPLILGETYVPHAEPLRQVQGRQVPNRVQDEFLTGVTYVAQVVLTNPTPDERELEVLLQIPVGSLPAGGDRVTDSVPVRLSGHGTTSLEVRFWFPLPGDFTRYPTQVGEQGRLVAHGQPRTFHVVSRPSTLDTESWEHVSQEADEDALLTYLEGHNLAALDLGRIAWRMRDAAFFGRTLDLLRQRLTYQHELWSFALLHGDEAAAREYLAHVSSLVDGVGRDLHSPLLTVDPVERLAYQHLEFDPLVNARAHRFGAERRITDDGLARQYLDLLDVLAYRPELDDEDRLSVTYYLALQDRVEETLATFATIDPTALPTRVQYDYLSAYLDFYSERPTRARALARAYAEHPVPRWRARFAEVARQLDEIEGVPSAGDTTGTRDDRSGIASEPALALTVQDGRLLLEHANLESALLNVYEMDVEFLFSTNPFVQQDSGSFSFVRPRSSRTLALEPDGATEVLLPEDVRARNVLVEVRAAGIVRRETSFAHSMVVQTLENRGQLLVTARSDGRALPRVYVKVYARDTDGEVRFHKDGYTDLRGRFDYASLSGGSVGDVSRFALLVLSEEHGAVLRELEPPTR